MITIAFALTIVPLAGCSRERPQMAEADEVYAAVNRAELELAQARRVPPEQPSKR
jgi:hypothetical protein